MATINGTNGNDVINGTSGDDIIHAKNGNDSVRGGAGDDFLHGGNGVDTAIFSGSIKAYTFSQTGANFFVTGIDGADRLLHFERLQFDDALITLGVNNAPIAFDDAAATDEDAGTFVSAASVLANDYDFEGDALTAVAGSFVGTYGTLNLNADGTYTYVLSAAAQALAQGQVAQDVFTYTVSDGSLTDTGTLTINLAGRNDTPVANADSAATDENDAILIDVLANDSDVDNGAVLTVTAASAPAGQGSATIVGNQVRYDPGSDFDHLAAGQTAAVLLTYTISDEFGATATSTVSITVTGTNDGPVANPDSATTAENTAILIDVLANDSDPDGGATLTVVAASAPAGQGSATLVGNQVRFDPGSDFDTLAVGQSAVVLVSYTIQDDQGATASSTISVTVTGENDGPVANADSAATSENDAVLIDVIANDTDVDNGAVLTVTAANAPAGKGSATIVGNQVRFDPGADFDGLAVGQSEIVTISYTISDEHGATASATAEVTVTGTNDGPVANPDGATTGENSIVLVDVLANDTDVDDGAILTVTSASAALGSASVVGNQVQFDPGSDFDYLAVGESTVVDVAYTISDEHGATSSSTIAVTVTGANDAPTIDAAGTDASGAIAELPNGDPSENAFLHQEGGAIAFDDLDLTDTHSASFAPQSGGYLGTFTLDPVDQSGDTVGWNFEVDDSALDGLDAGEVVTQTYTIQISDGNGGTVTQDVTITLTGAADIPDGVWFIDNSAAGSANLGTQADPFTSIAAFNAAQGMAGGPQPGQIIYLREGTGTYAEADGINLLDGQTLIGGGEDLVIAGITYETGTGRPTIVTVAGANHGVELAQDNVVRGFDIGDTTGADIADGGGSVGNLLIANVGSFGAGQIIDIDQGGTLDVTLNAVASTGSGSNAIDLDGVGGSFTVTGATTITGIQGGAGIDITNSSLNATFAGGGLVSTANRIGVQFVGNSGQLAITGGNFDIVTTTGSGLVALGGGSILVTGSGNDVTVGSGTAVSIAGTIIGAAGVTLSSVTSTGAPNGIFLADTGAGAFSVTGTGIAGSGGAISDSAGAGIVLIRTGPVSLASMTIANSADDGISGDAVKGLNLDNVTIANNGNAFGDHGVDLLNVSGRSLISGSTFTENESSGIAIANSTGSAELIIRTSSITGDFASPNSSNGLSVALSGSASLSARVTNTDFTGNAVNNLSAANTGAGTLVLQVGAPGVAGSGGTFGNANTGININHNGVGRTDFDILNATLSNQAGQSALINVNMGTAARGPLNGNIIGNDITNHASAVGPAVRVQTSGNDNVPPAENVATILIQGNDITNNAANIGLQLRAASGNSTLNATVRDNVIANTNDFASHVIEARAGAANADSVRLNLDIANNVLTLDPDAALAGAFGIRLVRHVNTANAIGRIEDYGGSPTDAASIAAYLSSLNGGASASAQVNIANGAGWGFIDDVFTPAPPMMLFGDVALIP
jgi:VCBS repeat-containing protein